ncbi:DUF4347 domain-containing protein [Methylohalobius crimeensis]|uniref:DUF4347 domain-containing protein n=1 Tax=Methylohalobius crimeensis TaxID=244365 RepID=UPI0003B37373|nr:DUF4347 domain-containing protein [Methylohalobius crimeensis]
MGTFDRFTHKKTIDSTRETDPPSHEALPGDRAEVAVVDTSVDDYQVLADAAAEAGMEVILLSGEGDGVEELAAALEGREAIDGLHILSHGDTGEVHLGDGVLSSATLDEYGEALETISGSLSDEGDLLLYGCRVGEGKTGMAFVEELAVATGADVAASNDATGNFAAGGDWVLEVSRGVSDDVPLSSDGLAKFQSLLAYTGNISFDSVNDAGAYSSNPADDAKFNVGSYLLVVDGQSAGTGAYSYSGNSYVTIGHSGAYESQVTLYFSTGETFDANSIYIYNWSGPTHFDTFTISSDNGDSTTSSSLANSGENVALGWSGVSKIYITAGDGGIFGKLDDFDISNLSPAASNTPPLFATANNGTIAETASNGATVLTDADIEANDGDGGANDANITYAITAGNPDGDGDTNKAFAIDSASGTVTVNDADDLDYETHGTSYTLTIQADDGESSNNTTTTDVTVTVSDIAPAITSGQSFGVNESDGDGTSVGTVAATGDDDSITFSIQSGNTGSAFAIDSSTGEIIVNDTTQLDRTNNAASYTLSIRATDGTTNADQNVTVNVTDDVAPTVTDGNISLSGASGTGGIFKVGDTVTATWNDTAGGDNNSDTISSATVDFSAFGGGSAVAASNSSDTWTATYTIVAGAIDGTNLNVSLTATDDDGNPTTTADSTNAAVDNVVPTVTDANISISGASGTGGAFKVGDTVTATWNDTAGGDNNSDTISGVTVDFSAFGGGTAVAASNSAGTWTATYTLTEDGGGSIDGTNLNLAVTATDNAGNATTTADTTNATVDNDSPGTPTGTLAVDENSANGTAAGTVTGGGSDGVTYSLADDAGGRFAIDGSGNVTVADGSLLDREVNASHDITVRATDDAGNTTDADLSITINNVNEAPVLANLDGDSVSHSLGANGVSLDANGDAAVSDVDSPDFDGGNVTASIVANGQAGEDVLAVGNVGAISVTGSNVVHSDGGGTVIGTVSGGSSGNDLVVSLNANATSARVQDLARSIQYANSDPDSVNTAARTVRITVTDGDGGTETSAHQDVTVNLVRAPLIDLDGDDSSGAGSGGYSGSFTEGGGAVAVADSDSAITDDGTFKSLSVTLTNRPDGTAESLASAFGSGNQTVNGEAVTIGAYDSGTGQLTVTVDDASADATTMQMLMASIRYDNGSDDPDTSDRSITFSAVDNDDNAGADATATISVEPVNDRPTLTAAGSDPTYTEDDAAVTLFSATSIDPVESADNIGEVVLTVTNVNDGADERLSIDGQEVVLTDATSGTTSANGFGYSVAVSGVTATVTLTKSATAADWQTLIDNLGYRNASDAPDTSNRTVTLTSVQDTGGTANGGEDTHAGLSVSSTVTVVSVNDAPTAADRTVILDEDSSFTFTAGDFNFSDVDSGSLTQVQISDLPSAGSLALDGVAVSANQAIARSDIDAGKLTFTPAPDANGTAYANFDFKVHDGADYSTASYTQTIDVSAVNDAPELDNSGSPSLTAIDEDSAANDGTLISDLLGTSLTDVDAGASEGIAVTSMDEVNGAWEYSTDGGVNWIAVGTVGEGGALLLAADADTRLRFVPDADWQGTTTVSYRGWDTTSGSIGTKVDVSVNGGSTAFSSASETAALTVNTVNDVPTIAGVPGTAQSVIVGQAASLADFTVADVDGDDLTVTLTASNGTIRQVTDSNPDADGIQLTGAVDTINAALADATFTAAGAGDAGIDISVTDGIVGTPVTATYLLEASNPPLPSPSPDPEPEPEPGNTFDGVSIDSQTRSDGTQILTVPIVEDDRQDDPDTPLSTHADIPVATDDQGRDLLTVSIPTGVGLNVEGRTMPLVGQSATDELIRRIETMTESGSPERQSLTQEGQAFLNGLPSEDSLVVKTVLPTVAGGNAPGAPIIVTGNQAEEGTRTALVIDVRDLPSGTVLQIDNVDFVTLIGSTHAVGGQGRNVAVGDDSSQFIVLGEDDDRLHGNGGDDTVGSLGGDDQTFGGGGADIVYGGADQDILSGGSGRDRLNGGFGFDVALQSGELADYIMNVNGPGVTLTHPPSGEVDTFIDVERIQFDTGESLAIAHSRREAVAQHLVTTWLDRDLTREEAAAVQNWGDASPQDLVDAFQRLLAPVELQDKSADELLAGLDDNPSILSLDVDRDFVGGEGNDQGYLPMGLALNADGGTGHDVLQLSGGREGVHLEAKGGSLELTRYQDGAMLSLTNAEMIAFDDGDTVVLAHDPTEAALGRLVHTFFDRSATADEWQMGREALQNPGITDEQILNWFQNQTDFASLNDGEYIQTLYQNTVGRDASVEEVHNYQAQLEAGALDRNGLAVDLAQSDEALATIGSVMEFDGWV